MSSNSNHQQNVKKAKNNEILLGSWTAPVLSHDETPALLPKNKETSLTNQENK